MEKIKQLWALVKFQTGFRPWIFIYPIAMAAPQLINLFHFMGINYIPNLSILLSNQNIFFVGLIGMMLLVPEAMMAQGTANNFPSGTEFLITRAVDRRLVFRARSVIFYVLLLAIPCISLIAALPDPGLHIMEYQKLSYQAVLNLLPGSTAMPANQYGQNTEIFITEGKILVAGWHIWATLSLGIIIQAYMLFVYPLKYRRIFVWIGYAVIILVPLRFTLGHIWSKADSLSGVESGFLFFGSHQLLFWLLTLAAIPLSQIWCEYRFINAEH